MTSFTQSSDLVALQFASFALIVRRLSIRSRIRMPLSAQCAMISLWVKCGGKFSSEMKNAAYTVDEI